MTDPVWLTRARAYLGLREIVGPKRNSQIVKWWQAIKAPFRDDETSWCGGFVGGVLAEFWPTSRQGRTGCTFMAQLWQTDQQACAWLHRSLLARFEDRLVWSRRFRCWLG